MVTTMHLISHISVTDYCLVSAVVAGRSLAVALYAAQGASAFLYDPHTLLPDRNTLAPILSVCLHVVSLSYINRSGGSFAAV